MNGCNWVLEKGGEITDWSLVNAIHTGKIDIIKLVISLLKKKDIDFLDAYIQQEALKEALLTKNNDIIKLIFP